MVWRLSHPLRGMLAVLVVWMVGGMFLGFGVGVPEMIGLTILATAAFVLANRPTIRKRATSA